MLYVIEVLGILVLIPLYVIFVLRPLWDRFGRPQAISDRQEPQDLSAKVASLEAEVLDLRQQLRMLQESQEFTLKLVEEKEASKTVRADKVSTG